MSSMLDISQILIIISQRLKQLEAFTRMDTNTRATTLAELMLLTSTDAFMMKKLRAVLLDLVRFSGDRVEWLA